MDNNYKVKIDLRNGIVEVEGDKEFIQTILEQYGEVIRESKTGRKQRKTGPSKDNDQKSRTSKPKQVQENKELLEYLNAHSIEFASYLSKYKHRTLNDRYLIYIKFLKENSMPTTTDNIYTCDTQSGSKRISRNPYQKLVDLGRRGTNVYCDAENNWQITAQGNAQLKEIEVDAE